MRVLKPLIIGLLISPLVLLAVAPNAYAIMSPKLEAKIALIKEHAFQARQLNGTGGASGAYDGVVELFDDETMEKIKEDDRIRRETNTIPGLPGLFHAYRNESKAHIAENEFGNYGETFSLLFNYLPSPGDGIGGVTINSCVRDDLFELQDLRDAVLNEALRSALLQNDTHAKILWSDYNELRAEIDLLKAYVLAPQSFEHSLFFESGQPDYYRTGACPRGGFWGDFSKAFEQLGRSWDVFTTSLGGGLGMNTGGSQWGSIWEMALARGKVKAAQWVRKNQISLTLGGEQGGSDTSLANLLRREGLGGVGNVFEQEWRIAKSMVGPVIPLFDHDLYFTAAQAIAVGLGANESILDDNACAYYYADKNIWTGCTASQLEAFEKGECRECRDKVEVSTSLAAAQQLQYAVEARNFLLGQTRNALQFNLQFNSIAEQSIVELDKKLRDLDAQIRRGINAFDDKAGASIPDACEQVRIILLKQCPNKGGVIPEC
ncbi:MAG: hypothetical protein V1760_03335 [Candidatus Peregrinibacteria bacterium]